MDSSFIDTLLSPILDMAGGEWLKNRETKKKFENDIKTFLNRQKQDTHLDIFKFAERPEIRRDEEFIPLEQVYVPMRLQQISYARATREEFFKNFNPQLSKTINDNPLPDNINIAQLLQNMHTGGIIGNIMIIGSGGSGKSTFCKYIARFFASDEKRQVRVLEKNKNDEYKITLKNIPNNYIPIYIRLRDLEGELKKYGQRDWKDNFSFEHFFKTRYNIEFETPQFFSQLFRYLPCLFLIDGIDEVTELKIWDNFKISRNETIEWLINRVKWHGTFHQKTSFILTSRPTDTSILSRYFQDTFKILSNL